MKFEVVKMADVPEPPPSQQIPRKYQRLWDALVALPPGEKHAIKLVVDTPQQARQIKQALARYCRDNKRRLLSSRNEERATFWLWLMDTPPPKEQPSK